MTTFGLYCYFTSYISVMMTLFKIFPCISGSFNPPIIFISCITFILSLIIGIIFIRVNRKMVSRVQTLSFSGRTMGTSYHITVCRVPRKLTHNTIDTAISDTLNSVEQNMSPFRQDSELSRFNLYPSNQPFRLSSGTLEVFRISQQVSQESEGAFDITIGPLVDAWGFGPVKYTCIPDRSLISSLLQRVGYHFLDISNTDYVTKQQPGLSCNLSAVAKGYGVDKIADALERLGISHYLIEVGGEVCTRGLNHEGRIWHLAIEKPTDQEQVPQLVLELSGVSMATSGDYRIFRMENGARISHEIDPRTGMPITHNLASVSVIHPSCAYADAYATALMVLGPEKALEMAQKHQLAIYMLVRQPSGDFLEILTPELSQYICHCPLEY